MRRSVNSSNFPKSPIANLTAGPFAGAAALLPVVAIVLLLAAANVCHREQPESNSGFADNTRVLTVDGVRMAFEIMTMARHNRMMEAMKITMDHDPQADHAIMLTLIDEKEDRLITDARVQFTIIYPDRTRMKRPGMIMPGKNMFHYVADFRKAVPGTYGVEVVITRGKKRLRQSLDFELK